MKRLFILILTLTLIVSICPFASATGVNFVVDYLGNELGQYRVAFTEEVTGTFVVFLFRGVEQIYSEEKTIAGIDETYGLPKKFMPKGEYTLMVKYTNPDGVALSETITIPELGMDNPNAQVLNRAEYGQGNIGYVRAVMTPYATVYSNDKLTGIPVAQLKRHDLVRVELIENGIAKVKVHVQSGDGTVEGVDNVNGNYVGSENDFEAEGYMSESTLIMPTTTYESDLGREVMELAYTRLGSKGIYSQAKRYTDYYLDCAAYAAWCWYQVGVDMSAQGTNTHGLAQWARGNDAVVWEAEEDSALLQSIIADNLPDFTEEEWNNLTSLDQIIYTYAEAGRIPSIDGVLPSKMIQCVAYKDSITAEVVKQMQPGDIVFFNYKEDRYAVGQDMVLYLGTLAANEKSDAQGHDHVALFAGYQEDELGNITAVLLESANPTDNTTVTRLPLNHATFQSIVLVARPTGDVTQIDNSGNPVSK